MLKTHQLSVKTLTMLIVTLSAFCSLGQAATSIEHTASPTHTKVISKITDVYQIRSGKAQLVESEYEVGTFNDVDGLATDIQTLAEKEKVKNNPVQRKLDKVIKISGNENQTIVSKKISGENCIVTANQKYCSTSIELTY